MLSSLAFLPRYSSATSLRLVGGVVMILLVRRARKAYEAALVSGGWHEGIIVFPSGDVVVRFSGLLRMTDKTIEAVYLSRADIERRCAWHRCGPRYYILIHYLGLDARPAVVAICETQLRDNVVTVAEFINDLKSKQLSNY